MVTRPESWVLDEVAYAGRENLDATHVTRYDRKENADAAGELASLVAFGLGERPTVIDVGAGTGQFTLAASEIAEHVVAVDVSPTMLDILRRNVERCGARNIECVQAGFLTYRHEGDPADLVYSRFALHHLPDFWKAVALTRLGAVLRPGGILRLVDIVYNFDAADAAVRFEQWVATTASDTVEDGWTRAELEEHVRDENSTFTWLLEPMIVNSGFVIAQADYSDDGMLARYMCVKGT